MNQPQGGVNEVGVDLYRLWVAGQVLLPRVAEVYEDNNQDIHNTGYWQDAAFLDEFGHNHRVFTSWTSLRNSVQTLFARTAMISEHAGMALLNIARSYAAIDEDAAAAMQGLIAEYRNDPSLAQPPGPLELESPGQPYETTIDAQGNEVPVRDDDE